MTPNAMSQVKSSVGVHNEAFLFSPEKRWGRVGLPDIYGQGEGGLEGYTVHSLYDTADL